MAEGHFAAGSMLPKIKAALDFIEHGGTAVIITSPQLLKKAIGGNAGTRIYRKEP
jgi:carbamate kinase